MNAFVDAGAAVAAMVAEDGAAVAARDAEEGGAGVDVPVVIAFVDAGAAVAAIGAAEDGVDVPIVVAFVDAGAALGDVGDVGADVPIVVEAAAAVEGAQACAASTSGHSTLGTALPWCAASRTSDAASRAHVRSVDRCCRARRCHAGSRTCRRGRERPLAARKPS